MISFALELSQRLVCRTTVAGVVGVFVAVAVLGTYFVSEAALEEVLKLCIS